jgi:hypothetical protein
VGLGDNAIFVAFSVGRKLVLNRGFNSVVTGGNAWFGFEVLEVKWHSGLSWISAR